MKTFSTRDLASTLLCAMFALAAAADRTVELVIHCRDQAGAPIVDVPVAGVTSVAPWQSFSGPDGDAHVKLACSDNELVAYFQIRISATPPLATDAQQERIASLIRQYAISEGYAATLQPNHATVEFSLTLTKARSVRARFVDEAGAPLGVAAFSGTYAQSLAELGGVTIFAGVPDGESCVLAVWHKSVMWEMPIAAGIGDSDLGDVQFVQPIADAGARLSFVNFEQTNVLWNEVPGFVLLVSTDGERLVLMSASMGTTYGETGPDSPAKAPAGDYFVCPFEWSVNGTGGTLIKLVRGGENLAGTGIPQITLTPGQTLEQTFDAAAIQKAILDAGIANGLGLFGHKQP